MRSLRVGVLKAPTVLRTTPQAALPMSELVVRPCDAGDVWTWTAICADTKLLCTFLVGDTFR
jgi:hypothetical protein